MGSSVAELNWMSLSFYIGHQWSQVRFLPHPRDMELRDYQNTLISEARLALSRHKHIIVQSPTGSG